ncbi:MAG TPA: aminotransferase class I/II-fold pyridoxal phosphate-dependent enzyme [Dermatophilaceae bacterium]|nr:aminotransferase class I/II-fold pyridoxal phosphate-dependent enzyme [Dermatophilaceae bacterium]
MAAPILGASAAELRRDRTSVKWRLYPADVLPLWVAEMDAAPCPPVVTAVEAAMRRGDTGYELGGAYVAATTRYAVDSWGWEVDPGACRVVADVMIGVSELLRLVTDPGAAVVVSPPCYDSFFGFVEAIGRRVVQAPLTASGRLDPTSLEVAFREVSAAGGRAAYLLCNPQNPTGAVHTPEELATLAALAEAHGVRVVSDEIHAPLVHAEATFTPYLTVPGAERGFAVFSPSKGWNLAGLKAAVAVAGPGAVDDLRRLHEVHGHGASHVAAIAHTAALDDGREWLAQLLHELDDNRRLLAALLEERLPAVRYRPGEATYLAWLDCRGLGLGDDPARVLLQRGRVALSPGRRYGAPGSGFARLNLAASREVIEEAVDRMVGAL